MNLLLISVGAATKGLDWEQCDRRESEITGQASTIVMRSKGSGAGENLIRRLKIHRSELAPITSIGPSAEETGFVCPYLELEICCAFLGYAVSSSIGQQRKGGILTRSHARLTKDTRREARKSI